MDIAINDEELLEAVFCGPNKDSSFQLKTILEFSQPMLLSLSFHGKTHLIYVLRDMTRVTSEQRITIQELLFSEVNEETVAKLIENELSIYEAFFQSQNIWRLGKIGNKIFPRKTLLNFSDVQDRFPLKNITLRDLPNKAL